MPYSAISFDLQGTLSDSAFSDEFWLDLLPILYSERLNISIQDSKKALKEQFGTIGKYDRRYYCPLYWIDLLCPRVPLSQVFSRLSSKPLLYPQSVELIRELSQTTTLIILSTTTTDFIKVELREAEVYFQNVYSCLDSFQIAGKTPQVFQQVAAILKSAPSNLLHIGDCKEMDIANAQAAGWHTYFVDKKLPVEVRFEQLKSFLLDHGHGVSKLCQGDVLQDKLVRL